MSTPSDTPGPGRPPTADPLIPYSTALPYEAAREVDTIAGLNALPSSAVIRMLVLEALRARAAR